MVNRALFLHDLKFLTVKHNFNLHYSLKLCGKYFQTDLETSACTDIFTFFVCAFSCKEMIEWSLNFDKNQNKLLTWNFFFIKKPFHQWSLETISIIPVQSPMFFNQKCFLLPMLSMFLSMINCSYLLPRITYCLSSFDSFPPC